MLDQTDVDNSNVMFADNAVPLIFEFNRSLYGFDRK